MRLLEIPVETSLGTFPVAELSVAGFRLLLAAEARKVPEGRSCGQHIAAFCPDALPVAARLTEADLAEVMAAAARLNPDLFQDGLADGAAHGSFSGTLPPAGQLPPAGLTLAQLEGAVASLVRAGFSGLWDWPFSAFLALARALEKEG